MEEKTIYEVQKNYKQKLAQLVRIGQFSHPTTMKKLDVQLNKEYKELLSEFHLVSAKLSLLKKLCGESQRLTRQAIKRKKVAVANIHRAKIAAHEEQEQKEKEEKENLNEEKK